MSTMNIDGACLCGAVRIHGEVRPENTIICHCSDCQTVSGAPYRVSIIVAPEKVTIAGETARYDKIGGSGARVGTCFCPKCGTALFSRRDENTKWFALRVGWLRQRAELVPTRQGFCQSALPWSANIEQIEVVPARGG